MILKTKLFKKAITKEKKQTDGRGPCKEVRELYTSRRNSLMYFTVQEYFIVGNSRFISFNSLGGPEDRNTIDGMKISTEKRFMHHYNFLRIQRESWTFQTTNRREVGHGALSRESFAYGYTAERNFPIYNPARFRVYGF